MKVAFEFEMEGNEINCMKCRMATQTESVSDDYKAVRCEAMFKKLFEANGEFPTLIQYDKCPLKVIDRGDE